MVIFFSFLNSFLILVNNVLIFLINLSTTFKNLIDYYGRIFHYIMKLDNFEIIEISLLMFHFSFLQKVILHSQDFGLNISIY